MATYNYNDVNDVTAPHV